MRLPLHDESFLRRGAKAIKQTESHSDAVELEKKRKRRLPLTLTQLGQSRSLSIALGSFVVLYVCYMSILLYYSPEEANPPHIGLIDSSRKLDFIVAGFPKRYVLHCCLGATDLRRIVAL